VDGNGDKRMTSLYRNPSALGTPAGLYSQIAKAYPPLYFVAGQLPLAEDGSIIGERDFAAQLTETFRRIAGAAASVGLSLEHIVQLTTYLTDAALVGEFYEAREKLFSDIYPSGLYPPNTLVVVSRLVKPGILVEVQCVVGSDDPDRPGGT
jgi:2-iminobutanoate/2-iminopropanoate deaminase